VASLGRDLYPNRDHDLCLVAPCRGLYLDPSPVVGSLHPPDHGFDVCDHGRRALHPDFVVAFRATSFAHHGPWTYVLGLGRICARANALYWYALDL
jgi:hypothetical protein